MTSWRESDPEPAKPSRPSKPVKPTKPVSPTQKDVPSGYVPTKKSGWRGKSKGITGGVSQVGSAAPSKTWLNPEAIDEGFSRSTIGKWAKITLLFTVLIVTTSIVINWILSTQPKLPFYTVSVGNYQFTREFRETPYGRYQSRQIHSVNTNHVFPFPDNFTDNENDKILGLLNKSDWLEKLPQRPQELIELGDPVTAYYINCVARFQEDSVELYHQSSVAFSGGNSEDRSSVELHDLLKNLASAVLTKKQRYLWVILDLQLPNTVSALGDLDPSWKKAVSRALERFKKENTDHPDWYERLIVTIPADDGQNNWLAPEYSASFFGYHLFKLLDTPQKEANFFRRTLGWPTSLEEFQASLDSNVSQDVARRRFARQTPVWLPSENIGRLGRLKILGASRGTYEAPPIDDPSGRMRQIVQLWKKFNGETLRDAYRWDPVGYAKVESLLLALEDFAIYQPASFSEGLTDAEQALSRLLKPQIQYGVSLIEDGIRADYFGCAEHAEQLHSRNKITRLLGQNEPPEFWKTQNEQTQAGAMPQVVLTPREKQSLVWETFLAAAKGSSSDWIEAFRRNQIEKALNYLKLDFESDQPTPIEIYLLHRMKEDIDWRQSASDRDRAEACAAAVRTFDELQRLASSPEPLLTRVLRELLQAAESDYLLGFDWLLASDSKANNLAKSIEHFAKATAQLQSAKSQVENLSMGIETAQETLWLAPHLLAWLLREYQFSEDSAGIEASMMRLGQAVDESLKLLQNFSQTSGSALRVTVDGKRFRNELESLKLEFTNYVDSKTGVGVSEVAPDSPQTLRRNRIAVKSPLLNLKQREKLHQNFASYLANFSTLNTTASDSSLTEQKDLAQAIRAFLGPLSSASSDPAYKQLYVDMIEGDLRHDLRQLMSDYQLPSDSDGAKINMSLSQAELRLRVLASVIGDAPSMDRYTDSQLSWPFSAASLRWKLAETERCVWQVARLAEAGWGNGEIPNSPDTNRFYFGLLGNRYLSLVPTVSDPTLTARHGVLIGKGRERLDERGRSLTLLTVQFGKDGQPLGNEDVIQSLITVNAQTGNNKQEKWNAVAAIFMGKPGEPIPWQKEFEEDRVQAIPLKPSSESSGVQTGLIELSKTFSTSYWKGDLPIGNLALRGNYRKTRIEWRSDEAPFIPLELTKDIRSDAEIYVDAAGDVPILNVVVLLDCSNSMKLKVDSVSESEGGNAGRSKVPLFKLVTSNAKLFIRQLAKAHDHREADIRVCLIPFGISHHKSLSSEFLKSFLSENRDTANASYKDKVGHFYASKQFLTLDEVGRFELERAIDELVRETKPKYTMWDTPLYDSILEALARIKRQQGTSGEATSHVVAFTDGVHYVEEYSPYLDKSTSEMVLRSVQSNQSRLSIFHYDYFNTWIRTLENEGDRKHFEKVEARGVPELQDLMRLSNQRVKFVHSSDSALLVRESLKAVPSTQVVVKATGTESSSELPVLQTRDGFQVRIAAELLPRTFEVTSQGSRGGATQRVTLFGGERVELKLGRVSGREFGFPTFDPESSRSGAGSGWKSPTQRQRSGGGFSSNLWYAPDWDKPLSFVWMMRDQEHPKRFTVRPRLAVCMIYSRQDGSLKPFVLADSFFEPNVHYPRLLFSPVPWIANTSLTHADLTLWVADELPPDLERKVLEPEAMESGILKGKASLGWKRSGNSLNIDVHYATPPKPEDRIVVICPSAESTYRKFFKETNDEAYEFKWSGNLGNQGFEIQLTTIGELKSWVQRGLVTEFSVDEVPTRK